MVNRQPRYALWLEPHSPARAFFQQRMHTLRQRYPSPDFPPHLTLVSGIHGDQDHICTKFLDFCDQQHLITLSPHKVAAWGSHYQALVVAYDHDQGALSHLRQAACEQFALADPPAYRPHISLLYGDLRPEDTEALVKELGKQTWPAVTMDRCSLWRLGQSVSDWQCFASAQLLE